MSTASKTIVLESSDGETFEVDEAAALQSQTIKNMIEDDYADNRIPLPNVTSKILAKVLEYCKCHAKAAAADAEKSSSSDGAKAAAADTEKSSSEGAKAAAADTEKSSSSEGLKEFNADFVNVDMATLFGLISAANYLNIKSLLDVGCQTVADRIKDKSPEEVRVTFNIKNDFTPEEEAEVRAENAWAFDT